MKGLETSGDRLCTSLGKHLGFNPALKIPNQDMNNVYHLILAACLIDGNATSKNVPLALKLIRGVKIIPPSFALGLGLNLIQHGEAREGIRLLEMAHRMGQPVASQVLATYYMNGIPYTKGYALPVSMKKANTIFEDLARKGDATSALNAALIALEGKADLADLNRFRTLLAQSVEAKEDKASAAMQAWVYAEGVGMPADSEKAAEWKAKADRFKTDIRFYVTDFFNEEGWGSNPVEAMSLMMYLYDMKLVDMGGRRDLFFTSLNKPTLLRKSLEADLRKSYPDKAKVNAFLHDFDTYVAPPKKDDV